jgi:ABC-type multidrug transport system ATPase subunit
MGVQLQATSFQSELTIREIVRLYAGLYGIELSGQQIADGLRAIRRRDHRQPDPSHLALPWAVPAGSACLDSRGGGVP